MQTESRELLKCLRCSWTWFSRWGEKTLLCPKCHSSLWNKKKISKKCLRCSWIWIPRLGHKPEVCPKCRSPRWDQAKEKE